MDRKKFFAALRSRESGLFDTSLSPGQMRGIGAVLDEATARNTPLRHLAYILATDYHESGRRMLPSRENMNYSVNGLLKTFGRHRISEADARRLGRSGNRPADQPAIANIVYGGEWGRKNLGNTEPGDGWRFRGGSLPQITGRRNYSLFGIDPDRAADLVPSVRAMFDGMERGLFTGKSLDDFTDYRQMREVVNPGDRADLIAGYAEAFERALEEAGWDVLTPQEPRPAAPPLRLVPTPAAPPTVRKPARGSAAGAIAAVITGAGVVLAAKWADLTEWAAGLWPF